MEDGFDLAKTLFFGLIALTVPIAALRMFSILRSRAPAAYHQLETQGYVFEHYANADHDVCTHIWGRLAQPTPLYLKLSNWPGLRKTLGIADIETGDEPFDKAFWVRSNDEGLARLVLDHETRERLLELDDIEFQTGSPATLLAADYWPRDEDEQKQRTLWIVRANGKFDESQMLRHLEIARALVAAIKRVAPAGANPDATRTRALEGS